MRALSPAGHPQASGKVRCPLFLPFSPFSRTGLVPPLPSSSAAPVERPAPPGASCGNPRDLAAPAGVPRPSRSVIAKGSRGLRAGAGSAVRAAFTSLSAARAVDPALASRTKLRGLWVGVSSSVRGCAGHTAVRASPATPASPPEPARLSPQTADPERPSISPGASRPSGCSTAGRKTDRRPTTRQRRKRLRDLANLLS